MWAGNIYSLLFASLFVTHVKSDCGYKSCHETKEDQINIHLVPHSHDDLGWLKTIEQYYYGVHEDIQMAGVQYILDSVVDALQKNSDRRFIYVETGFFWKWWLNRDEETRNIVKKLVSNGQLEFISGGWSMNDEAATDYQTVIDQLTWGLRKLNETFGECGRPKVGWQIDPFGHSREMASIFAQLGFDGFFLNRIDYQDHEARRKNRTLEFVWRGSPDNLGEATDIYTNVLFRHYSAPSGLCFDIKCNDDSIIDDPKSLEYNVDRKALNFVKNWIRPATYSYASNNLLVPLGDDFNYQYAEKYFKNIDKLIKYMNGREFNGTKYNLIYSTPSCYLNSVYKATKGILNAPLKTDDFFPYASSAHNYWTGYYTSRPTGKRYSRFSNNFLQICKQLSAITNATSLNDERLDVLREALAVFQHHDGITGTEKENVTYDYNKLLHNGLANCESLVNETLRDLVKLDEGSFVTCPRLNISECINTENEDQLVITVYNPLGRPVDKLVILPIVDNTTEIIIRDPSGNEVITQTVPIHPSVLTIPGRNSTAKYEIIFIARKVPPLGFRSYFYEKNIPSLNRMKNYFVKREVVNKDAQYEKHLSANGPNIYFKDSTKLGLSVGTGFYYYSGFVSNKSSNDFSPSTPYVFRPDPDIPLTPVSRDYHFETYSGPLMHVTHWTFNNWFSYVHRTYGKVNEFNYLVGPLPYDKHGVEVIARYKTDLVYDDSFYTDTNGRETIRRIRDYRPSWDVNITEPVAGNYYPITSYISITNGSTASVSVVTDRSQGGGSIDYQYIELMIHRNTILSGQGVGEPLNEQAYGKGVVTRGSQYLVFGGTDHSQLKDLSAKEFAQQVNLDSWIFFSPSINLSLEEYEDNYVMEFSGLVSNALPRNVHILTLEPWGESELLLRLENFIGKDDVWRSGTSTVNIKNLFATFDILSVRETTLGANQWLEENNRIRFSTEPTRTNAKILREDEYDVILKPMEIRTFVIYVAYK